MGWKIPFGSSDWTQTHIDHYLKTDGAEGALADFSPAGGSSDTPCLLLRTKGRKSGEARIVPLIYGKDGETFVIVASKGGAPDDPAWFLNLEADPVVEFQVGGKKWRGVARAVPGDERQRLYAMMADVYPPYLDYQAKTDRQIPVVRLQPESEIAHL